MSGLVTCTSSVLPAQIGLEDNTGVAGLAFTVAIVEPGSEAQPAPEVTVTE